MPSAVPKLELTIPGTSTEGHSGSASPPAVKVGSVFAPERPQKLESLWTMLHRRNVHALAAARKKSEKGLSPGVPMLLYGDSIMEAFLGLRWGLPLTQLAFMHDLTKRYFSHMPAKFCAVSDDGVAALQYRLLHGEEPVGLQAKLAIVLIGSHDVGKCGTSVQDAAVQEAMRDLAGQIMGCVDLLLKADKKMHVALIGIPPQRNMATWGPVVQGVNKLLKGSCKGLARTSFHDLTANFVSTSTGQAKLNRFLFMDEACLHPNMSGMEIIGKGISSIMEEFVQPEEWSRQRH